MSRLRFRDAAARTMRSAIRETGGMEVFAIGDVEGGHVVELTITCRGQADRVTALFTIVASISVFSLPSPSSMATASEKPMLHALLIGNSDQSVHLGCQCRFHVLPGTLSKGLIQNDARQTKKQDKGQRCAEEQTKTK